MAKEEFNSEDALKGLLYSINTFEGGNLLGKNRLYTYKTDFSVKNFTDLIFNPILGLDKDLIKKVSSKSSSSQEWVKRVLKLKKIYFSITSVKTLSTQKKSVQLSLELLSNGSGNINDTKPVILLHLCWCKKYQFT